MRKYIRREEFPEGTFVSVTCNNKMKMYRLVDKVLMLIFTWTTV